jgi:DNA-directed RNA polymerase subunit RPC12/RpoP
MPLLSWKNSNPPHLEEGKTYDFTDLQLVYGKEAESYKLVVRSKTEAIEGASFPSDTPESVPSQSNYICLNCQTSLSEANRHTGPEAPEVGWEYLECPDCGNRQHPDAQPAN